MKKSLVFLLLFCFILCLTYSIIMPCFADQNSLCAEIVMDTKTNRVLYSKNENEKMFMASTTKILTAVVVIENCNLQDKVIVGKETVGVEGSSIYLEEGEILTVKDLLYGLMLRSGNDCAETLAVFCSGSIKNFAKIMNDTAYKIGATHSNFVNPHGLHDDNHYTTAYDLALISSYAIKIPEFKKIVSTKTVEIPNTKKDYNRKLKNKNKMLTDFDGATGIKTGYTKKAGRCLVSSCTRNGMELVSVVLNCPNMWEESKYILTNSFNEYKYYKLFESDNIVDFINTNNDNVKCGVCIKNDVILPLTKDEYENLYIVFEMPNKIDLPIKKDEEIGKIKFLYKNNLLFYEKIYTIIGIT